MGFLDSIFSRLAPAATETLQDAVSSKLEFEIPPLLLKLPQSAGDPSDDVAAQLRRLLKEQKAPEAIDLLATQLPEREAIQWASDSCDLVAPKLTPDDNAALESCKAWLTEPSAARKDLAAAAAVKAGHGGPGAWAAQAVAWSQPAEPAPTPVTPTAPLLARAVSGCVMLAAALSKPGSSLPAIGQAALFAAASMPVAPVAISTGPMPASAAVPPADELCLMYKPFIDKGIAIAAGN